MKLLLMRNHFIVYWCAYVLYVLPSSIFISMCYFFHAVSQRSSNFSNFLFFLFFDLCDLFVSFLKVLNITNSKWGNQPLSPSSLKTESWHRRNWRWFKTVPIKRCTSAGKAHGPTYYNTESFYIVKDIKDFINNSWQLKQYIIFWWQRRF